MLGGRTHRQGLSKPYALDSAIGSELQLELQAWEFLDMMPPHLKAGEESSGNLVAHELCDDDSSGQRSYLSTLDPHVMLQASTRTG